MFKTLIILYALNFWVIECTPNPGRSFPHWPAPMSSMPTDNSKTQAGSCSMSTGNSRKQEDSSSSGEMGNYYD